MKKENLRFEDLPEEFQKQRESIEEIKSFLLSFNSERKELEKLYNLKEAASYCRMAVPTFRNYLSKNLISGVKFGKAWVFKQSDLDNFIENHRIKSINEIREDLPSYLSGKSGVKDSTDKKPKK